MTAAHKQEHQTATTANERPPSTFCLKIKCEIYKDTNSSLKLKSTLRNVLGSHSAHTQCSKSLYNDQNVKVTAWHQNPVIDLHIPYSR